MLIPCASHVRLISLALCACLGSACTLARADLIRADTATATSTFSGSYAIANAINGSGLPANFGPSDPHATYVAGNHWTTASGHTIGESATFFFTTPKSLGGFYMWAHRSNNIATNPYYAATRFDLILRDAGGNVLASHTDLVGIPGITTAQPYAFNIVGNVSSVQFIVRATANGNVSPYTGLAEVAFESCFPATSDAPLLVSACPTATVRFDAIPGGSGPFTFAWETLDDNGSWVNAADGAFLVDSIQVATITGSHAQTVQIALSPALGDSPALRQWRCTVTNACGQETSQPADLVICPTDFDCSGFTDLDDFISFVHAFEEGTDNADFDGTGFVDLDDFISFVHAFEAGC